MQSVQAFNQRTAMSKAQKGNKEHKKPKADKNQSKANVSAELPLNLGDGRGQAAAAFRR
jgi:hypothetical protein